MNKKSKRVAKAAIAKAFAKVGGGANLARMILQATGKGKYTLGYTPIDETNMARRIAHWKTKGKIPTRDGMVILVEHLTGVPRHKLAPDVYPAAGTDVLHLSDIKRITTSVAARKCRP